MRRIALLAATIVLGTSGSASAATITVDSTTDEGTGCTLREAVAAADGNANTGDCTGAGDYGNDMVTFAAGATGLISLDTELSVNPTAPGTLHIAAPVANGIVLGGEDAHRVLNVTSAANSVANAVTVSGLTIRDGLASDFPARGGGVRNAGRLTLDHVTVRDNVATSLVVDSPFVASAQGGGVFNEGSLSVIDSTIRENQASGSISSISGNFVEAIVNGGGIWSQVGSATIRRSTISGNSVTSQATTSPGNAQATGGGIGASGGNSPGTNLTLELSTVVGNSAAASSSFDTFPLGGGVYVRQTFSSGAHTIKSTTIADNDTQYLGANLTIDGAAVSVQNTVLAEADGITNCLGSTPSSAGHNFSDDTSCELSGTGDQQGSPAMLQAVTDVGGPTQVRRPAPGSPLIDAGVAAGQTTDQRGLTRTVDYSTANGADGDGTDIGAVEIQGATPVATSPPSPSTDTSPEVTGTTEPDTTVQLYRDASCTNAVGSPGSAASFAAPGITAGGLDPNTSSAFRARATYGTATSACSSSGVSYVVPPTAPVLATTTDPPSPASDNTPRIKGTANAGTTVNLYTTSDCSGDLAGTGSAADLSDPGIEVTVPDNSSTTFYAQATSANGSSPCSAAGVTYVVPPAAPVLATTAPASPADDNTPHIQGSSNAGTTVSLYTAPDCSGDVAGTGSDADLSEPGIEVTVPDNSTTTFHARATSANGTSPCSAGITYVESTPAAPIIDSGKKPRKKPKCKRKPKKKSAAAAKKKCKRKGKKN